MTDRGDMRQNGTGERAGELDAAAQRELAALNAYLAGLQETSSQASRPPVSSVLSRTEVEPIGRWFIVLRGVTRLTEVAGLRAYLADLPLTIAVRVVDVGSDEMRLALTASGRADRERIEGVVRQGLRELASTATFELGPVRSRAAK